MNALTINSFDNPYKYPKEAPRPLTSGTPCPDCGGELEVQAPMTVTDRNGQVVTFRPALCHGDYVEMFASRRGKVKKPKLYRLNEVKEVRKVEVDTEETPKDDRDEIRQKVRQLQQSGKVSLVEIARYGGFGSSRISGFLSGRERLTDTKFSKVVEFLEKLESGEIVPVGSQPGARTRPTSLSPNPMVTRKAKKVQARLSEALARNHLSQYSIAQDVGVSYPVINKFLAGKSTPQLSNLIKIEKFLDKLEAETRAVDDQPRDRPETKTEKSHNESEQARGEPTKAEPAEETELLELKDELDKLKAQHELLTKQFAAQQMDLCALEDRNRAADQAIQSLLARSLPRAACDYIERLMMRRSSPRAFLRNGAQVRHIPQAASIFTS